MNEHWPKGKPAKRSARASAWLRAGRPVAADNRASIASGRWQRWADRLSTHHTRFAAQHLPVELTILRFVAGVYLTRERVMTRVPLLQQFNVTIQALLNFKATSRQTSSILNTAKTETHVAGTVNRHYHHATNNGGDLTLVNFGPRLNLLVGRPSDQRWLLQTKQLVERLFQSPPESSKLPRLQAAFLRLSRTDKQPGKPFENEFGGSLVTQSLRRVFDQVRRFEEASRGPITMTAHHAPQFINARVSSPNVVDSNVESFRHRADEAWERFNPPPPPPVNIEMITDNVMRALDRRIVAARERLGKI